MKVRIINLKLSGIKNIEKVIELSFMKKNFTESAFTNSYIKTIYGPNGSGKTGIINAFEIYRHLVTSDFPFISSSYNTFLPNMINKKTKCFFIDVDFAINKNNKIYRFNHSLEVKLGSDSKYYFSHESIHILNSRLDKQKLVYESSNGIILTNVVERIVPSLDSMILKNNSVVRLFCSKLFDEKNNYDSSKMSKDEHAIVSVMIFALSLFIAYGDKQDKHTGHFAQWITKNIDAKDSDYASEYVNNQLRSGILTTFGSGYFDVIYKEKDSFENYKKTVKKMEAFIKLLKQELIKIDVKKKSFGEMYFINLVFIYRDYEVEYEYESTGVKKLCMLFSAFLASRNGKITIIDEIDSNIHDTFLTKLFDYFITYSDAQIICTTHNVEIMSITSSRSKTIDFLSSDNRIIPWIKTGRLSPAVLYLKGRIKFIPFNLDSSEFAEVFIDE